MPDAPESGGYVTVERLNPDGTTTKWVDHTRLTDGRVMCCLCFKYTPRSDLTPAPGDPGCVIDVCKPCHAREAQALTPGAPDA